MSCRVVDAVVGGMDGAGADEGPRGGVVLAVDIAGAASRAATSVRKTKSFLYEPIRCAGSKENITDWFPMINGKIDSQERQIYRGQPAT